MKKVVSTLSSLLLAFEILLSHLLFINLLKHEVNKSPGYPCCEITPLKALENPLPTKMSGSCYLWCKLYATDTDSNQTAISEGSESRVLLVVWVPTAQQYSAIGLTNPLGYGRFFRCFGFADFDIRKPIVYLLHHK